MTRRTRRASSGGSRVWGPSLSGRAASPSGSRQIIAGSAARTHRRLGTIALSRAKTNADADAKLRGIAEKNGFAIAPQDPQTEEGKSLMDRMKAETALLGSLQGDAFDKEYMTLVTNTQQSVTHFLEATRASAKDPDVHRVLGEMTTTVQTRLKTAQDIMAKIYGNNI